MENKFDNYKINRPQWSTKGYSSSSDERDKILPALQNTSTCKKNKADALVSSTIRSFDSEPGNSQKQKMRITIPNSASDRSSINILHQTPALVDKNSIERLTAEVRLLREHNKELVGRLDETSVKFEQAQRISLERKKSINKKDEIIQLLQQEIGTFSYRSNKGSDGESHKGSHKLAIIGSNNELQYKSIADALAAKESIKDNQSSYSNLVGSCITGDTGNKKEIDTRVCELEKALKAKTNELELLRTQDSGNFDTICKLRQLIRDRDASNAVVNEENRVLVDRLKSIRSEDLGENNVIKKEKKRIYHKLFETIDDHEKEIRKLCDNSNVRFPAIISNEWSSDYKDLFQKITMKLQSIFSLIKMLIDENQSFKGNKKNPANGLMKKICEQAKEKHELQTEVNELKENVKSLRLQQKPQDDNIPCHRCSQKTFPVNLKSCSSLDNSTQFPGKISHTSSDSACGKDISYELGKFESNVVKNASNSRISNQIRDIKKILITFHETVRKDVLEKKLFELLPCLKTHLSSYFSTNIPEGNQQRSEYTHDVEIKIIENACGEISELMNKLLVMAERDIEIQTAINESCKILLTHAERLDTFADEMCEQKHRYVANNHSGRMKHNNDLRHFEPGTAKSDCSTLSNCTRILDEINKSKDQANAIPDMLCNSLYVDSKETDSDDLPEYNEILMLKKKLKQSSNQQSKIQKLHKNLAVNHIKDSYSSKCYNTGVESNLTNIRENRNTSLCTHGSSNTRSVLRRPFSGVERKARLQNSTTHSIHSSMTQYENFGLKESKVSLPETKKLGYENIELENKNREDTETTNIEKMLVDGPPQSKIANSLLELSYHSQDAARTEIMFWAPNDAIEIRSVKHNKTENLMSFEDHQIITERNVVIPSTLALYSSPIPSLYGFTEFLYLETQQLWTLMSPRPQTWMYYRTNPSIKFAPILTYYIFILDELNS